MKFDPSSEWTGGGLITNPAMLAEFYAALASGRVVKPDTFEAMLEAGWRKPGSDFHYGYGMFVYRENLSFGHSGLWPGYRSHVVHVMGTGVTVAVQTNRDGRIDLQGLALRVLDLAKARALSDDR